MDEAPKGSRRVVPDEFHEPVSRKPRMNAAPLPVKDSAMAVTLHMSMDGR